MPTHRHRQSPSAQTYDNHMRHVRLGGASAARSHTEVRARTGEVSGVAWPHSLQMNPCRSRCASARTQVSTDGVSISPLHMVSRSCSAGIRSTSTYSSASRGSG